MRLSNYFLPLNKDIPSDAVVKSHIYMLKAGIISKNGNGLYTLLPMGFKIIQKIEKIIQKHLDKNGAHRLNMTILQNGQLWNESGRNELYGPELLRIKDRHNNDLIFSPTNEENIVDIFRTYIKTYKSLPLCLYQINWKFRDERRPRFGLLRAREFLMMDAYSFHVDQESAIKEYNEYYKIYMNIFYEMGLKTIGMKADTGEIGGEYSHEFQVLAEYGESTIYYDQKLEEFLNTIESMNEDKLNSIKQYYAVTEEKYLEQEVEKLNIKIVQKKGIEVGQIFYLGKKYTEMLNVKVTDQNNQNIIPEMCTYGIGVTRVMAAFIEANHDDKGIIWSKTIAPFDAMIVNLDIKDEILSNYVETLYAELKNIGLDILLDDTNKTVGEKFAVADLIGIPYQIIIGKKNFANQQVEIKNRKTNERTLVNLQEVSRFFKNEI